MVGTVQVWKWMMMLGRLCNREPYHIVVAVVTVGPGNEAPHLYF
jgi:hypothetical protein